jgi:hypothetical protein
MIEQGSWEPQPVRRAQLRIGDAERERAATALGEHFAAGRLDRTEFDSRLEAAYSARTEADLYRLFVDLPSLRPPRQDRAVRSGPLFPVPLLPILMVFVLVASVAAGYPPVLLFPLLWLWFGLRRRVWR